MKKILLILFMITFIQLNAQSMVGVIGGYNLTMEKEIVGVMINKKIPNIEDISVGMGYMTPIHNLDKGTVMANYQMQIFDFGLGGGVGIPVMDNEKIFPFLLVTYKPIKSSSMKIFLNSTEKRHIVGLSYPILRIRK